MVETCNSSCFITVNLNNDKNWGLAYKRKGFISTEIWGTNLMELMKFLDALLHQRSSLYTWL